MKVRNLEGTLNLASLPFPFAMWILPLSPMKLPGLYLFVSTESSALFSVFRFPSPKRLHGQISNWTLFLEGLSGGLSKDQTDSCFSDKRQQFAFWSPAQCSFWEPSLPFSPPHLSSTLTPRTSPNFCCVHHTNCAPTICLSFCFIEATSNKMETHAAPAICNVRDPSDNGAVTTALW